MPSINPINSSNNYPQPLTLEELEKMDEPSIFNKLDKDKSGTISDEELKLAGFIKDQLYWAKNFLVNRFGREKVNNNQPGETYFDHALYTPEIKVAKSLEDIPQGSHGNIMDARGYDISGLELSDEVLLNLTIDKTTILSPEQKKIINIYTEKMKNPGLGIRDLHAQGITGKDVHIAIIDQPLGKHEEYSANIRNHTDVNSSEVPSEWEEASMHGAAVTSIAVGKSVGVAPDAEVDYYSAVNVTNDTQKIEEYKQRLKAAIEELKDKPGAQKNLIKKLAAIEKKEKAGKVVWVISNTPYVNAIQQVLDKNKTLPPEERVSVISISWGFDKFADGFDDLQQVIARAKEEGVFVVSTALGRDYGFETSGANRDPKGDADSPETYEAGAFFKENSENFDKELKDKLLLVPMDHRTVADFKDDKSFRYEGNDGGMSWSTPWLAGMYVLAKQVSPDITPEEFWDVALKTSDECTNNDTGTYIGRLINPKRLIAELQTME